MKTPRQKNADAARDTESNKAAERLALFRAQRGLESPATKPGAGKPRSRKTK